MNSIQRIIGACAAASLVAAGSIAAAQTQDFLSGAPINTVVRDAPFSADGITTVTQMLADGTRIERTTTSKFYRDSAGRLRREQTIIGLAALDPSRESETLITIVDPIAQATYVLNPATKMARRAPPPPPPAPMAGGGTLERGARGRGQAPGTPLIGGDSGRRSASGEQQGPPPPPPPPPLPPPPPASGGDIRLDPAWHPSRTQSLGTRLIEGLTVTGHKSIATVPTGLVGNDRPMEIIDEQWKSEELHLLVLSKHHDPQTGDVEYRLTNVSRAEPASYLFTVPSDYTVVDGLSPRRRQQQ